MGVSFPQRSVWCAKERGQMTEAYRASYSFSNPMENGQANGLGIEKIKEKWNY